MLESYPFPIYSGVLDPRHYKQINSAIWLFLWCVSATTKDVQRDGVTWGIVLGSKPVKIDELSEQFGVNRSTVKRWIETLEDCGYIQTRRAPYGLSIFVRNSKKFADRQGNNASSQEQDGSNMSHPIQTDGAKLHSREPENEPSNKDITGLKDVVVLDDAEIIRRAQLIEQHFVLRRGRGFNLSTSDFAEAKKMVADGIPVDLICSAIDKSFAEYKPQYVKDEIRSISYCIPRCYSEWERSKVKQPITDAVPHVSVALGEKPKQSQKQRELDDLRRRAEEARKREQVANL